MDGEKKGYIALVRRNCKQKNSFLNESESWFGFQLLLSTEEEAGDEELQGVVVE